MVQLRISTETLEELLDLPENVTIIGVRFDAEDGVIFKLEGAEEYADNSTVKAVYVENGVGGLMLKEFEPSV